MSTPRSAAELVPGDVPGLAEAARQLTQLADRYAGTDPDRSQRAGRVASAHAALSNELALLRAHATELYRRSAEVGVGDNLLSDREMVLRACAAHPERTEDIEGLVAEAIRCRLDWVDAQQDFVDAVVPLLDAPSPLRR